MVSLDTPEEGEITFEATIEASGTVSDDLGVVSVVRARRKRRAVEDPDDVEEW